MMVLVVLYFGHNRVFRLPKALPNREEGEPNRTFVDASEKQISPPRFHFPVGEGKLRSQ
jgi:hypothetical protein